MAGPRKPSSPTPDWRAGARPRDAPRKRKHVLRVLLSAAFLGLAGLFVWLLWPPSWPGVQLAVLAVTGYDIALPPVPFSYADPDEFRASSPDGRTKTLEELEGLSGGLVPLISPKEVLILYVSAHGVSDGGKPYLLCSDYFRPAPGGAAAPGTSAKIALSGDQSDLAARGRLPRKSVLDQVSKCQAKLKLVLLDCNHIASDPRLGMVVNEFPRLLEDAVKQTGDRELWVLSCSGPLEVSRVSYAAKRSLFAHFVTQGLRGSADTSKNGVVDLAEFYAFVRKGVAHAVEQQGARAESERPMLFQGGEGAVTEPPPHFLFRVRPKSAAEEETPEPAKQEVAAAEKGAAAGKKDAGATPAAPTQFPKARIRSLLAKAWDWRDKEQAHAETGKWSPVDYAPHLWREYQQLLLGYEMRYRVGAAWTESLLGKLRALAEGGSKIRGRLDEAKSRPAWEEAVAGFKNLREDMRIVEEAVKLKNELVFAAPYYVRWCGRSAIVSPESPVPVDDVAELVEKKLPEFIALLETFEEGNRPGDSSAGMEERVKKLRDRKEELETLRRKIDRDGLEQEAANLLRGIKQKGTGPEPRGTAGRIEGLLATPLLLGNTRMELLDALDQVGSIPEAASPAGDSRPSDHARADQARWERLARQARLEVQLVRLADPKFDFAAEAKFSSGARTPQEELARWEAYRKLGGELQGFYEGLPGEVHKAVLLAKEDPGQSRRARRLLPLVDARDVIVDSDRVLAGLGEQLSSIVLPRIAVPLRLEVKLPEGVPLARDGKGVSVPVQVTYGPAARVSLKLQYDDKSLEIKNKDGDGKVPGQISLDSSGKGTLTLEVRPRDVAGFSRSPLTLQLQVGKGEPTTKKIEFTLAPEDVVDLVIERIGNDPNGRIPQRASGLNGQGRVIACDVFPKRTTAYVFALKNLSHKKRKVTVEFSAPQRPRAGRRGGSEAPGTFQPAPDARPLAGPIPMELPADETAQPILFKEPKSGEKPEKPEKKEGAESGKPAAEKPKEPSEKPEAGKDGQPPAVEVPYGIVCVIRDADAKVRPWETWIDLQGVKPWNYLSPEVNYDAEGTIRVKLKPARDPQRLPLVSAEEPIKVDWETAPTAEGETPVTPIRQPRPLINPGDEDEVSAKVAADPNRTVTVSLAVDDYPRAFKYELPLNRRWENKEPETNLPRIRIRSPQDGAAFRTDLPNDAPLSIPVGFQAEAPETAFQKSDEKVAVWLEAKDDPKLGERTKQEFPSDRQWSMRWQGTGLGGMVKISATARDFVVPLTFRPSRTGESKVDVCATLALPEHGVTAKDAKVVMVTIVLDGAPPKILSFSAQSPVVKDADVPVELEVSDLSGIGRVAFGFVENKDLPLEDKDVMWTIPPAILAKQTRFDGYPVPTKDAKKPVEPGGEYYLAVRVWDKADKVGHDTWKLADGRPAVVSITIKKKDDGSTPEKMGTIEGQVYWGGEPARNRINNVIVQIKELGRDAAVKDDATFVFRGVPPGEYTIEIKSGIIYEYVKGSTKVTVSAGKAATAKIVAERK